MPLFPKCAEPTRLEPLPAYHLSGKPILPAFHQARSKVALRYALVKPMIVMGVRRETMNKTLFNFCLKLQDLTASETGQNLVEYAMLVALVAFGATASLKTLGTGVSHVFTNISSTLGSAS